VVAGVAGVLTSYTNHFSILPCKIFIVLYKNYIPGECPRELWSSHFAVI